MSALKDPTRILKPGFYTVRSEHSFEYFNMEVEANGTAHQLTPAFDRDGVLRPDGWGESAIIFEPINPPVRTPSQPAPHHIEDKLEMVDQAPQGVAEVMRMVERLDLSSAGDGRHDCHPSEDTEVLFYELNDTITTIVQERDALKIDRDMRINHEIALHKLRAELEDRVAELEDDAARLDWLEAQINKHGAIHLHDGNNAYGLGLGLRPGSMVRTLRYAIDDAKGPHHG